MTAAYHGALGSRGRVRVNTAGGTALAAPCAQANAGNQARIPYTEDYHLLSRS